MFELNFQDIVVGNMVIDQHIEGEVISVLGNKIRVEWENDQTSSYNEAEFNALSLVAVI